MLVEKENTAKIKMSIGLLGGGNMGEAIIKGLLASGKVCRDNISCFDPSKERLSYLKENYGINTSKSVGNLVSDYKTVIIAVKPSHVRALLAEIATEDDSLIISIVAGASISFFKKYLGSHVKIVRVMPNTPCLVLDGACVVANTPELEQEYLNLTVEIFETLGRVIVLDEASMDAVTGLSGSGPAFAFIAIDAMASGGVKMGLTRKDALLLAAQTFAGAAKMVLETGIHPEELRDRVSSPGGTTIAGIHRLEKEGFRCALMNAVESATLRSIELGGRLK